RAYALLPGSRKRPCLPIGDMSHAGRDRPAWPAAASSARFAPDENHTLGRYRQHALCCHHVRGFALRELRETRLHKRSRVTGAPATLQERGKIYGRSQFPRSRALATTPDERAVEPFHSVGGALHREKNTAL